MNSRIMRVDVTERKRAEDELYKLSRAVEQSPVSIVITDIQGTIEFVNPAFTRITGYSAEEAIGKNPRILKSGNTTPETYQKMWSALTSGETWEGEFLNKSKDGRLFWEHCNISVLYNDCREITHFLASKTDITSRKLLEAELYDNRVELVRRNSELEVHQIQLAAQNKDLEYGRQEVHSALNRMEILNLELTESNRLLTEISRTKSDFLANMSHELRTPLTAVIGFSEVLLRQTFGAINKKQQEYVSYILSSGKHLLTLINGVLDLSKVESGKMVLHLVDCDLKETLTAAVQILKDNALKGEVDIQIAPVPEAEVSNQSR